MRNLIFILTLLFLLSSVMISAQLGGGPPGSGGPPCWPPPCVPIDGGISFLILVGAIFGGKKVYNNLK